MVDAASRAFWSHGGNEVNLPREFIFICVAELSLHAEGRLAIGELKLKLGVVPSSLPVAAVLMLKFECTGLGYGVSCCRFGGLCSSLQGCKGV